jgi:hypothetical protein
MLLGVCFALRKTNLAVTAPETYTKQSQENSSALAVNVKILEGKMKGMTSLLPP